MCRSVFMLFFFFFLVSCVDNKVYLVEDELKPFVNNFELESAKRQHSIDFINTGLIVEFADLEDNTAGLCHFEKPIRIEIDRDYWQKLSSKSGDSLMKENIIFHELGHGFLDRDHDNTLLPNGDWKSMMCGGDDNERPTNINYRGIRREYYIDELFDANTAVPDFASDVFNTDTTGFTQQFYLSFDTEKNEDIGWSLIDNENYKMTIENKQLRIDSNSDFTYIILANTEVDVLSDFIYELTLRCQSLDLSSTYGMVFGNNKTGYKSLEYLSINNEQNMYMGNLNCYSYYTELLVEDIRSTKENDLKIVKIGRMMYFFVNNVYVYCTEVDDSLLGTNFGFIVSPGDNLWLDDMRISSKVETSQLTKVQNRRIEYTIEKIDFTLGKCKNH